MTQERIVYSFILAWIVLILVLIILDWLGNPHRGSFRPKGDATPRDRVARKAERDRQRLDDDAAVRAALRDAYGTSSLRLKWSGEQEDEVRELDDRLVIEERADVIDAGSREIERAAEAAPVAPVLFDHDAVEEDLAEHDVSTREEGATEDGVSADEAPATEDDEPQSDDSPEADEEADSNPARGWRVGVSPLAATSRGTAPAAATIRARAWKNHAVQGSWDRENLSRLRTGKAPRRVNPITGDKERATVDAATGKASWGDEPVDPFGAAR